MVTKLVKVVTYSEELALIDLHDPSMRWSCEVTWQIKYIISSLAEDPWTQKFESPISLDLWPPKLAECWFQEEGLARKHLSHYRLLVNTYHRVSAASWALLTIRFLIKDAVLDLRQFLATESHSMGNFFKKKKLYIKCGGETSSRLFFKK